MKAVSDDLSIVCVHVLSGQPVYHKTKDHLICESCFKRNNSYERDKNGCWEIPQDDLKYFKTVCEDCVEQIISKNKTKRRSHGEI